eukprot:6925155-Pyramimonas_sp.AAC.1
MAQPPRCAGVRGGRGPGSRRAEKQEARSAREARPHRPQVSTGPIHVRDSLADAAAGWGAYCSSPAAPRTTLAPTWRRSASASSSPSPTAPCWPRARSCSTGSPARTPRPSAGIQGDGANFQ